MIDVKMPQLGESVAEGTVTKWRCQLGDFVHREQPLVEVATDKADSEVPSPVSGRVVRLAAAEGEVVPTGGLLCVIDEQGVETAEATTAPQAEGAAAAPPAAGPPGPTHPSPAVRKLARETGVDVSELRGTGDRGRVTREDVLGAREAAPAVAPSLPVAAVPPAAPVQPPALMPPRAASGAADAAEVARMLEVPVPGVGYRAYKVPPFTPRPGDEVMPFTRRRRITADHMVYSVHTSPHVVTVAEIDLQATSRLRDEHKVSFERDGAPLTFLTFVVAAVVKALREHPQVNARVLDDAYVVLRDIHIGIAIETPAGLLVASIKDTAALSLRGIARSIDDLAMRAREGKVTADDLSGTTFTVSNPGRKGNLFGAAIISQPNAAILRIGEIKKRPVVVSQGGDDTIAIHPIMYAALSYDHRIIDGVLANSFLWRVADVLARAEFEP